MSPPLDRAGLRERYERAVWGGGSVNQAAINCITALPALLDRVEELEGLLREAWPLLAPRHPGSLWSRIRATLEGGEVKRGE